MDTKMKRAMVPRHSNEWGENLPEDIMKLIMGKLFFVDQQRFRAVCRRWRQKHMGPFPSPLKQLPWIFHYDTKSSMFQLFDPISKKSYVVHNFDHGIDPRKIQGFRAWASKEAGWLLMSQADISSDENSLSFFFYNPFTGERIQLPNWLDYSPNSFETATCSSSPTTADCMVFMADYDRLTKIIRVGTCHPGEKSWITTRLEWMFKELRDLVYTGDGILYIGGTLDKKKIMAFDVSDKTWSMLPKCKIKVQGDYVVHMVESDGELLLVFNNFSDNDWYNVPPDTIRWKDHDGSCDIRVFKIVDRTWVEVESLGNRAVFISNRHSITIEVSEAASRAGEVQADAIYYAYFFPYLQLYFLKKNRGRCLYNLQTSDEMGLNKMEPKNVFRFTAILDPPTLQY